MTDRLNELARAITEAEDDMNASNHRNDCDHLARMDEERPHLVERIEAREKALDVARDAMRAYAQELASEGAVKVAITEAQAREPFAPFQTAVFNYSNGLDGHQED
jgi:hypothetical protein